MNIYDHARHMPNDAYHAREHISATKYEAMRDSLLAYRHKYLTGKPDVSTPAQIRGSLAHTLTFEPWAYSEEYIIAPSFNLGTNLGKQAALDWMLDLNMLHSDEDCEQFLALSATDKRSMMSDVGLTIIDEDTYKTAERIAEITRPLLPDMEPKGVEAVFEAEIEGVMCQCKADYIEPSGQIHDLKTAANIQGWLKAFRNGSLVYKDAFYRMVVEAATGILPPPVIYYAVEAVEPFDAIIRYHEPDQYGLAVMRIKDDLRRLKAARDSDAWPGIDEAREPKGEALNTWVLIDMEETFESNPKAFAEYAEGRVEWPWESPSETGE